MSDRERDASEVYCKLKVGALISAFIVNGQERGVIVINPGEAPMLYRFDGSHQALAITPEGLIILPVEIEPGSSLAVAICGDHFEIEPAKAADLIKVNASTSHATH